MTGAALDRIVAAERGRGDVHEVALGVLEGGTFTHACAGDWQGRPVGPDTPFLIASTSKLLITAMVFQLVDEGRVSLDDPVVHFFGPGELDGRATKCARSSPPARGRRRSIRTRTAIC